MLAADRLSKDYQVREAGRKATFPAVKPLSFEMHNGGRFALVGESGSGKTTLVRMLAGLIKPTSGRVLLDGRDISLVKERSDVYRSIQIVFQDSASALNPHMTVYDLIAEPIRNLLSISRTEERRMVHDLVKRMDLAPDHCKRKPRELSGGQQKRVCIARAIGVKPEFLMLDEAFSGLDVIVQKNVLDLVDDLQKELGCAFLLVTHDMDIALSLADTILVMKDGEIVERAHPKGNANCLRHEYSQLLLQ